jgi:lipoprotein-releasing system ATP-binding protein
MSSGEHAGSPAAVVARGLTKSYGGDGARVRVFSGLDFEVAAGALVAVQGPSGVGKSTLLHLLGGIDRPDEGTVMLLGRSLYEMTPQELARFRNTRIGFIFQFHHLLPEFSAEENVMMPLRIGRCSVEESRLRARRLLDRVGLADRAGHLPRELSGGEQQRVAIARALVTNPSLLFADEPTGNLDAASASSVFDLFAGLHRERGTTTILVTHNPDLAHRCDKIFLMSREGIRVEAPVIRVGDVREV